jgi:MFS family permease
MRDRGIPQVVPLLFQKYSASDMLVGILMTSLPAAIGLLVSPVISYLSDRHRGRWGRRIPFLLVSASLTAFSILGLAIAPDIALRVRSLLGNAAPALDESVLLSLGMFWLAYELLCGVTNMLFNALINDVVPAQVLGRFFSLFRIVSLTVGIIFNHWIFAKTEHHYPLIFAGIGLLYGVSFILLCLKVKEGEYPPLPPTTVFSKKWGLRLADATRTYLKDAFGHSYYRWYFLTGVVGSIAAMPTGIYTIFYAKSLLMSHEAYGNYLAFSFIISLCLAYPLGMLTDRFHPFRLVLMVQFLGMLGLLWCAIYARDLQSMGTALIIQTVLGGCALTVGAPLALRLLPRDRFAQMMSAGGILGCIAGMIIPPILGRVLDMIHHQYIYIFHMSLAMHILAIGFNLVLYRKFVALGGPKNYVAPGITD